MEEYEILRIERLGGGVEACVSGSHTFGSDAFFLSDFAAPARRETVCDLGCGCGIVPLLWFREGRNRPKAVTGLDIQPEAVFLAERSALRSGLSESFRVILGDMRELSALKNDLPPASFDLVTCNPPYKKLGAGIPSGRESDFIARHELCCTISDVCGAAAALLRFGGRLCVCQLPERLPDVLEAMRAHRIEPKRLRFVQERQDTPPWLLLCEGKLGSKPFLQVERPLILRENGEDSAELREIYSLYRGQGRGGESDAGQAISGRDSDRQPGGFEPQGGANP